jgi:hypothetical protein
MRKRQRQEIQVTEGELAAMTRDLDDMHQATLPRMQAAIAELRDGRSTSRRGFLVGAASFSAGAVLLAACGSDDSGNSAAPSNSTAFGSPAASSGGMDKLTGDLAIAALAASLENLAVQTYQAGLDAAGAGKLGTVPPAVANFVMTVQKQHKDHAAAWNAILTGAGEQAVTGVDKTVQDAVVTPGFAKVTNVVQLATFAIGLEDAAAATYLNGIQNAIEDPGGIMVAATIQPVEMQHSAILHLLLGDYPVPDTFAKTDGARGPDDVIG